MKRLVLAAVLMTTMTAVGCSSTPDADGLRASFAAQLAANRAVKDFAARDDGFHFTGPGAQGEESGAWRVQIESASVEENDDPAHPYRGVVKSAWFAGDRQIRPSGRDSNLPIPLTGNGLAQECWALWDKAAGRWSWE
jgi:hypothetical protein